MLIGISDQMGTRFDCIRYEVFQNLILSPMNTGLLRPAVATVLTVYGIETRENGSLYIIVTPLELQQSLPFTVLKLIISPALTSTPSGMLQQSLPFTVLKRTRASNFSLQLSNSCNSPYRLRY